MKGMLEGGGIYKSLPEASLRHSSARSLQKFKMATAKNENRCQYGQAGRDGETCPPENVGKRSPVTLIARLVLIKVGQQIIN